MGPLPVVVALLFAISAGLAYLLYRSRSELRAESERRKRCQEELSELMREHEQFAYVASHDLQEPIRAVEGFAQLLVARHREELSTRAREYLSFVSHGAERLQGMVLGLLEYSRAGTAELRTSTVSIDAVLSEALASLRAESVFSCARVSRGDLPSVDCDPPQLRQLIEHLLTNAVRFSKPGVEPVIHVDAEAGSDEWVVTISDNGVGIPRTELESVFEPFKRLRGSNFPTVGMGLAICRRIASRHGGRVWVESEVGRGSRFYFSLPAPTGR